VMSANSARGARGVELETEHQARKAVWARFLTAVWPSGCTSTTVHQFRVPFIFFPRGSQHTARTSTLESGSYWAGARRTAFLYRRIRGGAGG
jgi:hypothetical protein